MSGSNSNFHAVLGAMRDHYKSGIVGDFAHPDMPRMLRATGSAPNGFTGLVSSGQVPDVLADVAREAKESAQSSANDREKEAKDAANQVPEQKNADDFKKKMEASRKKAEDDYFAIINRVYDKAIEIGEKQPNQQDNILTGINAIMGTLNKALDFLTLAIGRVVKMVMELWDDIIKGIVKPLDEITKTFAPVRNLIEAI